MINLLYLLHAGPRHLGLCQETFMRKLSSHLIELHINVDRHYDGQQWPADASERIGILSRLQALNASRLRQMGALALSLTRLMSLEQLSLHNAADDLIIPLEISCLQALTDVDVHRAADCSAFMHLPAPHSLRLKFVREPIVFPVKMSGLTTLTRLVLDQSSLTGHVLELSCLQKMEVINLYDVKLSADRLHADLRRALASLTGLVHLSMRNTPIGIQLRGLASLSQLTRLVIEDGHLEVAVCSCNWLRLRDLSLSHNRLLSLPSGVTQLSCLRTLSVAWQDNASFQLDRLGDCFGMPTLRRVSLQQARNKKWSADSLYCIATAMSSRSEDGKSIYEF